VPYLEHLEFVPKISCPDTIKVVPKNQKVVFYFEAFCKRCSYAVRDFTNGIWAFLSELFYGNWHGTYVPFSSVQSKLFVTVRLNH
jgi:hypothetical protein